MYAELPPVQPSLLPPPLISPLIYLLSPPYLSAQSAFDPSTGQINWDCPCLGGMADGPCGPQFKEAFSCFVFSEAEPKGIECVDKFKAMQDCFREYPEIYKEEIEDEERGLEEEKEMELSDLEKEGGEKKKKDE